MFREFAAMRVIKPHWHSNDQLSARKLPVCRRHRLARQPIFDGLQNDETLCLQGTKRRLSAARFSDQSNDCNCVRLTIRRPELSSVAIILTADCTSVSAQTPANIDGMRFAEGLHRNGQRCDAGLEFKRKWSFSIKKKWNRAMYPDAFILVTGAEAGDREIILQALGDRCHVVASQTMEDALAHQTNSVDLVISEIKSGQLNGLDLMYRWKLTHPETPFLMLADRRDITLAVEAMKNGAADCLVKPIDSDELHASALQLVNSRGYESVSGSDRNSSSGPRRKASINIPPDTSLEDLERAAVEQALVQHHGNRTHAARTLGISVRTLQRKLKAWGMPILSLHNSSLSHSFLLGAPPETPHPFSAHVH